MLTWQRKRTQRSPVAKFKRWQATEAPLAIVQVSSLFHLPGRWLAVEQVGAGEVVVGRHRTRNAAVRTCERIARKVSK